ncbi:bifunctional DNA primase/polymerase [Streptomyces katsurahamanus]|nr:bifunctional DNA primase/polymerase [Streptomyces katsurahamanus]
MTKRGLAWLSAAAEDPETCRAHWADDPRCPYALPAGRLFDVVTVGQNVGMEAFDQLNRRGLPLGPVMADLKAGRVGFFLTSRSRGRFERLLARQSGERAVPSYRYLDTGSFVVSPGPMSLAGDRYQWMRAPVRRPEASPLRVVALAMMLVAAADLVERVARYGEEYPTPEAAGAEELAEAYADAR